MDLFKLLGTIAIDNSDANKALDDTSKKGQQTESKLSKAFKTIGKGAVAVGKTVATGLAVAGTAMGALSVKALNLSGELEQNMGGSEAVFGEHAAKMQNTAKEAFSQMGLSTSDYLATANKMGALFQGAGFSVEESMNLSSDAMQRAADVASIMGIDTADAMEAIAGAAKGNFTMMDNLGVAMNDTAIQNYALSKGIKKSTAEMTQQEKIGLAMEMFLDKTSYAAGNYAKENETLAGSLGTAKAALTNFLDGSGDVDSLVSAFSNAANVIVDSLDDILPRLSSGLNELTSKVVPLLPSLLQKLLPSIVEGAVSLINGLVSALPSILDVLVNSAIPQLLTGLVSILDAIISALPQLVESISAALPSLLPQLIEGVISLIVSLCNNFTQILMPIIEYTPIIIESIVSALISNLPILIEGLLRLVGSLVMALPDILSSLVDSFVSIFTGIWDGIKNIFSNTAVGDWFKNVFTKGKEKAKEAWSNAKELFGNIWNGVKSVFSNVGGWFKDKFNEGKENAKNAWSNAKELFSNTWSNIKGAFSNVGSWFKEKFTSAKDGAVNAWSNVKSKFSSIKNGIASAFSNIKEKLSQPFEKARDVIKTVADKIKGFFKGEISMPKIKTPHFGISPKGWKIGDLLKGSIPKLSIKWYAEAMKNPMIMTKPTIFGYDQSSGQLMGGGEAGSEVVSGTNTLMKMIQSAVATQNDTLIYYLQKLLEILAEYFPEILEKMDRPLFGDKYAFAEGIAEPMDEALGKIRSRKDRGR